MNQGVSIGAVAVLTALSTLSMAADTHPFSVEDLARLNRLTEPALSPDGRHLVFTLRETDMEADRGRNDLWLLDVAQSKAVPKRLTSHPENDASPQWSRVSGHLYFLSSRSGSQQVWRLTLTGGEAQQVTSFSLDVTTFKLAPDDSHLAVTFDVFPDCADLACSEKRLKQQSDGKARADQGLGSLRGFHRVRQGWSQHLRADRSLGPTSPVVR